MSNSTSSSPTPPWKDEFNKRVQAFAEAIGVPEETVRQHLSNLGCDGETDRSLTIIDSEEALPFGDLRQEFVEANKVTKLAILRIGMPHLRGKTAVDVKPTSNGCCEEGSDLGKVCDSIEKMVSTNRPKADWSDKELLSALDESTTEIAEVLSKRTRGRHCIVFDGDGNVDVEASLELVKIAKKQATRNEHRVRGKIVRVYRAGKWLARPLDESPFVIGEPLVRDYCASSETDWKDISHEARVLARIYIQYCETAKLSLRDFREVCDDARKDVGHFREKYGKAAMLYDEMSAQDKLPKLKIMPADVSEPASGGRKDTAWAEE